MNKLTERDNANVTSLCLLQEIIIKLQEDFIVLTINIFISDLYLIHLCLHLKKKFFLPILSCDHYNYNQLCCTINYTPLTFELTLSLTTDFKLFQIETVCRPQF